VHFVAAVVVVAVAITVAVRVVAVRVIFIVIPTIKRVVIVLNATTHRIRHWPP
jgi:hypothetical protein